MGMDEKPVSLMLPPKWLWKFITSALTGVWSTSEIHWLQSVLTNLNLNPYLVNSNPKLNSYQQPKFLSRVQQSAATLKQHTRSSWSINSVQIFILFMRYSWLPIFSEKNFDDLQLFKRNYRNVFFAEF